MEFQFRDFNYEIPDKWLERAGAKNYVLESSKSVFCHVSENGIKIVEVKRIETPQRGEGYRRIKGTDGSRFFSKDRMVRILKGIVNKHQLPPIQLIENSNAGEFQFRLHDGFHRFYASFALGFMAIPSIIREEPPTDHEKLDLPPFDEMYSRGQTPES